jgi:hypothetical protein
MARPWAFDLTASWAPRIKDAASPISMDLKSNDQRISALRLMQDESAALLRMCM